MLFSTVFFWQVALAVHVLFVVLAFGLLLVYPFMVVATERIEPRFLPTLMRMRQFLGRTLVNPGLVVVVAAGVYLAADLHQWQDFYVQWGIGAVIVIAGLEGSFVIRRSGKLAELAQRDIAAAGEGEIAWSREYLTARGRADQVNALLAMIVVVTIFLMVVR
ncbi:MAG: hypothetical protein M0T77_04475 [Actinomycetota bacterium]|nr:hypothetical protein [Actinomycetota bacterium]